MYCICFIFKYVQSSIKQEWHETFQVKISVRSASAITVAHVLQLKKELDTKLDKGNAMMHRC